jgi:hypothetical protein
MLYSLGSKNIIIITLFSFPLSKADRTFAIFHSSILLFVCTDN